MTERAEQLLSQAQQERDRDLPLADAPEEKREPLLIFRVAGVWLAAAAEQIEAILELVPATPVPRAGPHVLGLVSHGDCPLAVIDLARMLGLGAEDETGRDDLALRRIVVVNAAGLRAGLVCERAAGVVELPASRLPAPSVLQGAHLAPFLTAEAETAQGRVGILDLAALLRAARVAA